jgi:anaerobic ribonucleoside-triphosphate reductase activating protein
MSPDSQSLDGGYLADTDALARQIIKSERTGLTISGGEPFIQAEQLAALINKVRETIDLGVIIYTGYTLEEIVTHKNKYYRQLLEQCDLLVDGAYEESLNDGKNLRGSSNQRVIPLTDRYEEFSKEFGTKPAEVEFFFQEDRISMVGVPSSEILERFKNTAF